MTDHSAWNCFLQMITGLMSTINETLGAWVCLNTEQKGRDFSSLHPIESH